MIAGEPSAQALNLTGRLAPAAGSEVVPTERARTLVAYLQNLNTGYDYPEARPLPKATPPAPKEEAKK
jgi:hypothetical protein